MVGVVLAAAIVAAAVTSEGSSTAGTDPPAPQMSVAVAGAWRRIPARFLGLSIEFPAVRAYTGPDPAHIDPVLVQLIRNLTPGQSPVLRIGGDSTDDSYVRAPGVRPPPYVAYPLTSSWLATTAALADELHARMIMGLNLADDQPALDRAEAVAFRRALGGHLSALEIGNEPDVYWKISNLHAADGRPYRTRPRNYRYPQFRRQFGAVAAVIGPSPLAGPALAVGPTPSNGTWVHQVGGLLAAHPALRTMTVHRYPLRNCNVPPSSPQYPTIAHLLSSYATAGLTASLRTWIAIAHAHGRTLRVDELNSVACRGKVGVSDTFASALWATDALFSVAAAGVDGVDIHTLPDAAYQLFSFTDTAGRWQGTVAPVYYGLQLFAQAAPAGARLLPVREAGADAGVSVWATRARDRSVRIVLINKNISGTSTVALTPPAGTHGIVTVERMQAPSAWSRGSVTLGGRTYGAQTSTGRLAPLRVTRVRSERRGADAVTLPSSSAALVTFRR
jgi:hypothetical protein